MKIVYTSTSDIDIQMLKGLLESEGISTQITSDGAGDYFNITGANFNIAKSVQVMENDYNRALDIAKENGFDSSAKEMKKDEGEQESGSKNNVAVWGARIAVVILVAMLLWSIFQSLL